MARVLHGWLAGGALQGLVLTASLAPGVVALGQGPTADAQLLRGAGSGDSQAVTQALTQGASVDVQDENGFSPLMFAALRGHADIVAILLSAGADPDRASREQATPLMGAAVAGHLEIVRQLVEAGADSEARNVAGATALVKAREYGHSEIEAYLEKVERRRPARPPASAATEDPDIAEPRPEQEVPKATLPDSFEVEPLDASFRILMGANLRVAPNRSSERAGSLAAGSEVRVTGRVRDGDWYRITSGRQVLYIQGSVLEPIREDEWPLPAAEPPPELTEPGSMDAEKALPRIEAQGPISFSGRWATPDNPEGCQSEFIEVLAGPTHLDLWIRTANSRLALAEAAPLTAVGEDWLEAGSGPVGWHLQLRGVQLLYSFAGSQPVIYERCE